MSSTRVARGNAAKLVYKTVGGKVETTLYCSTAVSTPAAAASGSQKKGRNCPDNERRKSRREAWLQRRTVPRPDLESTAATAASALEESLSSEASPAAVAAQEIGQAWGLAAPGTALTVPVTAAAKPPRVWAWEKRDGLVVIARRLQTKQLESPEMAHGPEGRSEFNLSMSSWSEERELEDKCIGISV
jgi:hypothetical protein